MILLKLFGYCTTMSHSATSGWCSFRSMNLSYKYRIYPTLSQAEAMQSQLDFCRFLYNSALEQKRLPVSSNASKLLASQNLKNFQKHLVFSPLTSKLCYEDWIEASRTSSGEWRGAISLVSRDTGRRIRIQSRCFSQLPILELARAKQVESSFWRSVWTQLRTRIERFEFMVLTIWYWSSIIEKSKVNPKMLR